MLYLYYIIYFVLQRNRKAPGFMNTATTGNACKVLKAGSMTIDKAGSIGRPPGKGKDDQGGAQYNKKGDRAKSEEYKHPPLNALKLALLETRLGIDASYKKDANSCTYTGTESAVGNIIICDESSMLSTSKLDIVNKRCQQVTGRVLQPFGGLSVLLVLDDFQLRAVGGEVLFEGAIYSMLSYEKGRPKVNSHSSQGRELYKTFVMKQLTKYNRAKDPILRDLLERSRNLTVKHPIDDEWISHLEEITAEKMLEEPGFFDAVIGTPGNRERRSLIIMKIEARARNEKGKVLKFRKPLKGGLTPLQKGDGSSVDLIYNHPDYKDELFQFYYPGTKAIIQVNISTSRGLSNGQVCTMVGLKYNDPQKEKKYLAALEDKGEEYFIEVDTPDYVLLEVDSSTGSEWEEGMSLIPGRFVFALPLHCQNKVRSFDYVFNRTQQTKIAYEQFEYELGSASTVYKMQGETLDFLLAQLNKNPNANLGISLQMLHVMLSRVEYLSHFRLLPLKDGRKSLEFLKDLKSNPLQRVLLSCYDPNGNWIGTRELIEEKCDEFEVLWREKVKLTREEKLAAKIREKASTKSKSSDAKVPSKPSQSKPLGSKASNTPRGSSSTSVMGKGKGKGNENENEKGKGKGKGKGSVDGNQKSNNSNRLPPPVILPRPKSNKSNQFWAVSDVPGVQRFKKVLCDAIRIHKSIAAFDKAEIAATVEAARLAKAEKSKQGKSRKRSRSQAFITPPPPPVNIPPPEDDYVISFADFANADSLLIASQLHSIGGWLDDIVIEFSMELWKNMRPTTYPFLLVMNCFFTTRLDQIGVRGVSRWTKHYKKLNTPELGKHLLPDSTIAFIAHLPSHWIFCAIKGGILHTFNGFRGHNSNLETNIQTWWEEEHRACNMMDCYRALQVNIHNDYGYTDGKDIQQTDQLSCGVSALMHAHYVLVNDRFATANDFSYDHILDLRQYIGNTICNHGESTGFLELSIHDGEMKKQQQVLSRRGVGMVDVNVDNDVDIDVDDVDDIQLAYGVLTDEERAIFSLPPNSSSEAAFLPNTDYTSQMLK